MRIVTPFKVLLLLAVIAALTLNSPVISAQSANPHIFIGSATVNGLSAPAGTAITAMIDGEAKGSAVVESNGQYGPLLVNKGGNTIITFQIDGLEADQIALWQQGGATELDLTASSIATPPHIFIGSASVNNVPAPTGKIVTAWIEGELRGASEVGANGSYGAMVVKQGSTTIITFKMGDLVVDQTAVWEQGGATALNLTASLTSFDCSAVNSIPSEECEALVSLYNSTDGPNWTNNNGWLVTTTPCSWYGITCSAGHVDKIGMVANLLTGSIPSELGNLTSLRFLALYDNQLYGRIPPEIGNLTSLWFLNFFNNQLSGNIPRELGNLGSLSFLVLGENQLSGSIPSELGNLARLQSLTLSNNHLSGSIPTELGNLASLQSLLLSDNQLTGSIPPEFGNLVSLQYLDLSGNQLTGNIPPELGSLPSLQGLLLSSNLLSGSIPPELGNLASLTYLRLHQNRLTGSIPLDLASLSLREFYFDNTDLCEPPDVKLEAWLDGIAVILRTGVLCGPGIGTRSTVDRPDDIAGHQVHVMYLLPSDGFDRELDTNGNIATSVAAFQKWLEGQTGGRGLLFDTYQGSVDITFFRLSRSDSEMQSFNEFVRDEIESEIGEAGFNQPNKIYAVYYDGGSNFACGGGAWPPGLPGSVGALYLRGTPPDSPACDTNALAPTEDQPGYWEFSMLHEILHTMGFVANCAPNHTLRGHVSDSPQDLMYAGQLPWQPSILDMGQDDYFGSLPQGCLDLGQSPFLEPSPPSTRPEQCTDPGDPEHAPIEMTEAANNAIDAGFDSDDAAIIVAIAWAESSGIPTACNYNPPTEISLGILQINILAQSAVADEYDIAFDPAKAFVFAYGLSNTPLGFDHWSAYTNGSYLTYLSYAQEAIASVVIDPTIVGTIAYPSLNCGGEYTLQNASTNSITLFEDLTYGTSNCVDEGTVTLSLTSPDEMAFVWEASQLRGTGTLSRISSAGQAIPSAYSGVWKGQGSYINSSISWSILIDLSNGEVGSIVGTIAYPSLNCGGEYTLQGVSANSITLFEDLTYGLDNCVDEGTVTLSLKSPGELAYAWETSQLRGTGTLSRISSAGQAIPSAYSGVWRGQGSQNIPPINWSILIGLSGVITAVPSNQPPVANAGSGQTVTDVDGNGSEDVTLNGSGSSDPDGNIIDYSWSEDGSIIATGISSTVTFSLGTHTVTLTVTDDQGASDTDDVVIVVSLESIYIATGDSVPAGSDINGQYQKNKANAYPRYVLDYLGRYNYNTNVPSECKPPERVDVNGSGPDDVYNFAHRGDRSLDFETHQLPSVVDCQPDLITLTIGADDILVPTARCFTEATEEVRWMLDLLPSDLQWSGTVSAALGCLLGVSEEIETLFGVVDIGLGQVFQGLESNTEADVLATGYHNPLPNLGIEGIFRGADLGGLFEDITGLINTYIQKYVSQNSQRFTYVDIGMAFKGHDVLASCSYIEPVMSLPVHPNLMGQQVIASLVIKEARESGFIPSDSPSRPFIACATQDSDSDVFIHGADFQIGARVTFGGVPIQVLEVSEDGIYIRVQAPAQDAFDSIVDIEVINPDGSSTILVDGYPIPDPPLARRLLTFFGFSPITLSVSDPLGRRVGFDSISGESVNEIPGALFLKQEGKKGVAIVIPDPIQGQYMYEVHGTGPGTYNLVISSPHTDSMDNPVVLLDVPISEGEVHSNTVTINENIPPTVKGTERSLSLSQDVADGATGFEVEITRVFDSSTNDDVSIGLKSFQARLTYLDTSANPAFPTGNLCVDILDVREMDFPFTGKNIDNVLANAIFDGHETDGVPWPADLGHALTRLNGSAYQQCRVDLELNSVADTYGNHIDVPPVLTQMVQRGDARADGNVTIEDAWYIAEYLVGSREACTTVVDTSCLHSVNAASVQQDGSFDLITIADALVIAQYLMGLRDEFYNLIP